MCNAQNFKMDFDNKKYADFYFLSFDLFKCRIQVYLRLSKSAYVHDRYISAVFKMLSEVNFAISTHLFRYF